MAYRADYEDREEESTPVESNNDALAEHRYTGSYDYDGPIENQPEGKADWELV